MKLLGYSSGEWLRVGLCASLFILVAKWLVPKAGVPALTQTVERI
jgi:hypothetical protein